MAKKTYLTKTPSETKKLGQKIAKTTFPGHPIALIGDLGAGKTTFVQGFGEYFGLKRITSPTYTFIKEYKVTSNLSENTVYRVNHIDLYRATSTEDALSLGIKELLYDPLAWTLVEWPELILDLLPKKSVIIKFTVKKNNQREITITQ